MGGLLEAVEHTVSGIAGRRNHEGSPLQHAMGIIPAAVGMATGNPWMAAAAGAAAGAANGGGRGAITGALGSGIGAWLGNTVAFNSAQSLPALALGKTNYVGAMTGLGTLMGSGLGNRPQPPVMSVPAPNGAPINIPSFEQLKQNAIVRTQEAFDREGVYHLLNPFRRFNREIPPTERDRFPSLKRTAKERAKKRIRNG